MTPEEAKLMIQQVKAALDSVGLPNGTRSLVIVEYDTDDNNIAQVAASSAPDEVFDMMERALKSMCGYAVGDGTEIDVKPS